MALFILKDGNPIRTGIAFCSGFLVPGSQLLDISIRLCDLGLGYLLGCSFLITLLSEAVIVHCHGRRCELGVRKQVLSQFN
jgi:hypothetical protein